VKITEHFDSDEFACHDGTPYPMLAVDELDPHGLVWGETRLRLLCETLEVIRAEAGDEALIIDSGFRTIAFDERLYERSAKNGDVAPATSSQHPKGRASDVRHARLSPAELHALILRLWRAGKLPHLGGLGLYPTFVHIDVRPRSVDNPTHLAQWTAGRASNSLA
jgi:hypothetical protein